MHVDTVDTESLLRRNPPSDGGTISSQQVFNPAKYLPPRDLLAQEQQISPALRKRWPKWPHQHHKDTKLKAVVHAKCPPPRPPRPLSDAATTSCRAPGIPLSTCIRVRSLSNGPLYIRLGAERVVAST